MARACSRSRTGRRAREGPDRNDQDRRPPAPLRPPRPPPPRPPPPPPVTEDGVTDELVDTADVDSPAELDLDVTGSRPQLDLGVEVEGPRILRGPHVDGGVRQRVHLDLPASQALGVLNDEPLGGEDCGVTEGSEGRPGLLIPHEQLANILGDRHLRLERPCRDRRSLHEASLALGAAPSATDGVMLAGQIPAGTAQGADADSMALKNMQGLQKSFIVPNHAHTCPQPCPR